MSRKRRAAAAAVTSNLTGVGAEAPAESSGSGSEVVDPGRSAALTRLASLAPLLPGGILALAFLLDRFLPLEEPDLWWHFTVGRDIANLGIQFGDVHSYTLPGYRWVDHEWLLNWLMYRLVGDGASTLPVALLCLAITVGALGVTLLPRRGVAASPLAAAALLPLGAWAIGTGVGMRPTVVSLLFLAIVWWWIRDPDWAARRTAWLLPALFVPWANLHGGFVVALALLGLDGVLTRLRGDLAGTKRRALLFVASFAATAANPYGLRVWHEAAVVFFDSYAARTITEWQPPDYGLPRFTPLLTFEIVASAFLAFRLLRDRKRAPILESAAVAVFLVLTNRSMRHAPLLVVVALPLLATTLSGLLPRRRPALGATLAVVAASLLLTIPAVLFAKRMGANLVWNNGDGRYRGYPAGAVDFLREQRIPSERIVSDYGWGGFVPWVAPGMKVFIDGRMASWNAPTPWGGKAAGHQVLREYHQLSGDPVERTRLLRTWNIGWFLGSRAAYEATGSPIDAENVVYADGTAVLVRIAP